MNDTNLLNYNSQRRTYLRADNYAVSIKGKENVYKLNQVGCVSVDSMRTRQMKVASAKAHLTNGEIFKHDGCLMFLNVKKKLTLLWVRILPGGVRLLPLLLPLHSYQHLGTSYVNKNSWYKHPKKKYIQSGRRISCIALNSVSHVPEKRHQMTHKYMHNRTPTVNGTHATPQHENQIEIEITKYRNAIDVYRNDVKRVYVQTPTRITSDWCCVRPPPPTSPRSASPLTTNTHPTLPYKKPTTPKNTGS